MRRAVQPPPAAESSVRRFVSALAFNWVIGGTDAHAKNYSVLLRGPQVRLAPLYDVASALPYDLYLPKLRMAMRVGGEYRVEHVTGRHWRRFAFSNDLDSDGVIADIDDLAARLPAAMASSVDAADLGELDTDLPARLLDRVTARARRCRAALDQL